MSDRPIVEATRDALGALPEPFSSSPLAAVALQLARRLDGDPADTAVVLLARELRHTLTDLAAQAKGGGDSDLDDFLARISTPAFGDGAD